MLYPAELWALNIGKNNSGETIFLASSTVGLRKSAKQQFERGKKLGSRISSGINEPAATMPESTPTAKRFGDRSRRSTSASPNSGLAEFLKDHRETRNAQAQASSAKLMFGTAAEIYRQRLNDNATIKPRRASFRSGEIRVLDSTANVERTIAFG